MKYSLIYLQLLFFPSNTYPYNLHVFVVIVDTLLNSDIAVHVCMMSDQLPDYWEFY